MGTLRKYFLTGVATILPIGLTIFVFWFLITRLGRIFEPLLEQHVWLRQLPEWLSTLVGFALVLIVVLAVGALASGLIGRWFLGLLDRLFRRLPFVKGVYTSASQFADAVFVKKGSFARTIIAEYPRHGILAIGFLTADEPVLLKDGRKAVFVYFPTTPNPTSGWLALVPEAEITETDMPPEAGLKLVVSGGVVKPESFDGWVRQAKLESDT